MKNTGSPYDGYIISGYIDIPTSYPNEAPTVYYTPTLPHINVEKQIASDGTEIGRHCGSGF